VTPSEIDLPNLDRLALVVVDVQRGFDDTEYWGPRNNPRCEDNIVALLRAWRDKHRPVVFVRHDSAGASSPLRTGQDGNDFKPMVTGDPDLLVTKHVNSAFHGKPDLDGWLRQRQLDGFIVCGITTNHCCETTARVGGNLGHQVLFALDATHTFDRSAPDGSIITADELARVTPPTCTASSPPSSGQRNYSHLPQLWKQQHTQPLPAAPCASSGSASGSRSSLRAAFAARERRTHDLVVRGVSGFEDGVPMSDQIGLDLVVLPEAQGRP